MQNKELLILEKNTFLRKMVDIDPEHTILYEKKFLYREALPGALLHPIAGCEKALQFPREITFVPTPYLLLIYCREGMLRIESNDHSCNLASGHFLAVPLLTVLHITTAILPCSLRLFAVGGDFSVYRAPLGQAAPVHPPLHICSPLTLDGLTCLPENILPTAVWDTHLLLTRILTAYAASLLHDGEERPQNNRSLPGYLDSMHHAIHEHSEEPYTLQDFEDRYGIGRYRLCREYRNAFGISPMRELGEVRIGKACRLLRDSSLPIQEIAKRSGYYDINNFTRIFRKMTGMTPGQYRSGATGGS